MSVHAKRIRFTFLHATSAIAIGMGAVCSGAAHAQPMEEQDASNDMRRPVENGEIVVTAQRQAQSLQRVPIAVTAIQPDTLTDLNLREIDKIEAVTPGLTFKTGYASFTQIYIRGIGTPTTTPGLENPVAIYIDGAYVPRGIGTIIDLVDPGSVEVLKGPQGTLYGRNATGGAILLNTANPTDELGLNASVEFGNFEHAQLDAAVNIPVGENLAFRFAGRYVNEDGFVRDVANGGNLRNRRSYTLRGKVKWEPSADFTSILSLEYLRFTGRAVAMARNSTVSTDLGFYEVAPDFIVEDPTRSYNANLRLEYGSGPIKVASISNYRDLVVNISDDPDHTTTPFFSTIAVYGGGPGRIITQDLQISSDFGGMIDFLAGVQYADDIATSFASVAGLALGLPVDISTDPSIGGTTSQKVRTKSIAGFAEVYVKPIERLTVTLGGRYSSDRRKITSNVNATALAIFNPGGPGTFQQRVQYKEFTPRFVVAYDADILNFYASYTRGFKAGGFNTPTFVPQVDPIRPETINSYEVGAKFESPDRRTRANLAVFRYDYKDIQVSIVDSNTNTQTFTNAASARGKGAELELSHRFSDVFNLTAGGAYLDAKYRNYPNAPIYGPGLVPTTTDLSGTRLSRAPKWSGFVSGTLEAPLGGGLVGRLAGVVRYTSKYLFNPGAGGVLQADQQRGLVLADISGGIGPETNEYEIGFYVSNLTDKKYFDLINTNGFGAQQYASKPRTYGARLKFQY